MIRLITHENYSNRFMIVISGGLKNIGPGVNPHVV